MLTTTPPFNINPELFGRDELFRITASLVERLGFKLVEYRVGPFDGYETHSGTEIHNPTGYMEKLKIYERVRSIGSPDSLSPSLDVVEIRIRIPCCSERKIDPEVDLPMNIVLRRLIGFGTRLEDYNHHLEIRGGGVGSIKGTASWNYYEQPLGRERLTFEEVSRGLEQILSTLPDGKPRIFAYKPHELVGFDTEEEEG